MDPSAQVQVMTFQVFHALCIDLDDVNFGIFFQQILGKHAHSGSYFQHFITFLQVEKT